MSAPRQYRPRPGARRRDGSSSWRLRPAPIPMLLWCPLCRARHVDAGEFAVKPHHTHACQACGHVWRPAVVPTVGVRFLPGFRDAPGTREPA